MSALRTSESSQVLEIAQPAMNELGAGRGSVGGEIVLLAEQDRETASRGIARDAGAVDAAADDQKIVCARMPHGPIISRLFPLRGGATRGRAPRSVGAAGAGGCELDHPSRREVGVGRGERCRQDPAPEARGRLGMADPHRP